MHFLVANLCWLLCFFGIQDSDDATTYTLEDGETWVAQLGQDVIVRAMHRDKEKVYTGKIDKLHEMYVKISGETIFIDDIVRVAIAREGEQLEVKKKKQVVTGYVVVELQGKVGIIPEDIAGKFSTEYISAGSIAKMLKVLNSYKKVQHIVFVIDSVGGDSIEIANIAPVLDKYKKRYTYHAIVAKKDTDPLQIASSCDGIFASEPFVQGGYDGVVEDFERSNALYISEFQKMFWKGLLQDSYTIQYLKACEFAKQKTNRLLPVVTEFPEKVVEDFERSNALYISEFQKMFWKGLLQDSYTIQYLKACEFAKQKTNRLLPVVTEFPEKSEDALYVIEKIKKRQIKDMVKERRALFALIQILADRKMNLLGLPGHKHTAETMNPSNYEYKMEYVYWVDNNGDSHRSLEFTQKSKDLWNKRLDKTIKSWKIIKKTLLDPFTTLLIHTKHLRIVRDEATSGTQREIREDAKLAIEEEMIKHNNAYEQAYPWLIVAEEQLDTMEGTQK